MYVVLIPQICGNFLQQQQETNIVFDHKFFIVFLNLLLYKMHKNEIGTYYHKLNITLNQREGQETFSMTQQVKVKATQSCPTLCHPMDYTVNGILQARILEWVAFPFSKGSSQLGIKPRSLVLQVNSLSAEPQEKPKNTGVGSLCLLQQIFPTQELNQNQTMVPYIAGGFFTN